MGDLCTGNPMHDAQRHTQVTLCGQGGGSVIGGGVWGSSNDRRVWTHVKRIRRRRGLVYSLTSRGAATADIYGVINTSMVQPTGTLCHSLLISSFIFFTARRGALFSPKEISAQNVLSQINATCVWHGPQWHPM